MADTRLELHSLVICDYALTAQDGKISAIGIFGQITVSRLPSVHGRFFIVAVLGNWFIGAMKNKQTAIVIALAVSFFYSVVWIVAAWRSSGNYSGFSFWRFLIRVVLVVIVLYWIFLAARFAFYMSR